MPKSAHRICGFNLWLIPISTQDLQLKTPARRIEQFKAFTPLYKITGRKLTDTEQAEPLQKKYQLKST